MRHNGASAGKLLWRISAVAFLVLALGTLLRFAVQPEFTSEDLTISGAEGKPLRVRVLAPAGETGRRLPSAVICQPLNNPPEFSDAVALELVHRGFVVLTFNWRGTTPEENRQTTGAGLREMGKEDVAAAVLCLQSLPQVDREKVCVAGHSVGGTFVLEAAFAGAEVAAVAVIGMQAEATPDSPRNLLWVVGLYDEFNPMGSMRQTLSMSSGGPDEPERTTGSMAAGTARRLAVAGSADHFIELQAPGVHRAVAQWFMEATNSVAPDKGYWVQPARLVYFTGWLLSLVSALTLVCVLFARRPALVRLVPAAGLCVLAALTFLQTDRYHAAAEAALFTLTLSLLAGTVHRLHGLAGGRVWLFLLRLGIVSLAAAMFTLVLNSIHVLSANVSYVGQLPSFALSFPLTFLHNYLMLHLSQFVFHQYDASGFQAHWVVYMLLAVEVALPGAAVSAAVRVRSWAKGRNRTTPRGAQPISWTKVALLLVVLAVLAVISVLRLQQGFLTAQSLRAAGVFILRYGILTVVLFVVLWRVSRAAVPRAAASSSSHAGGS